MSKVVRGGAPPVKSSFDDWDCLDCGNVNFGKRMECNRCHKPRPEEKGNVKKTGIEIGKQAAEKSKGLFSADDWMCTKCGNVNWARRKTCNTCNAPKFTEVEERTGLGGGFNERDGIEYKERADSDSEYDDFGRKKKKFRGSTGEGEVTATEEEEMPQSENGADAADKPVDKPVPPAPSTVVKEVVSPEKDEEDDDDEEEDEDDDGDTDKYKLFDDDEDDSTKPQTAASDLDDPEKIRYKSEQSRKRYPGSRSSESSSSSTTSSSSSSSAASSSRSRSKSPRRNGSSNSSRR